MDGHPARRRRWTSLGSGLLLTFVFAYVLVVIFYHLSSRQAVLDMMNVGAPLASALVCGFVARATKRRFMRHFWGLIAIGCLFAAVAEAMWAWYELVAGIDAPYPSFADIAWIAYYPLVFSGLMMLVFARGRKRLLGAASLLDALMFAVAGAGLGWEFLVRSAVDSESSLLANITSVAYQAADLLLLAGVVSLAVAGARRAIPRGTRWIVVSFLVTFTVDVLHTRMEIAGTYSTGSWIDPLWSLGYALLGVAAFSNMSGPQTEASPESDARAAILDLKSTPARILGQYMPYVAVLSAAVLATYHFVIIGGGSRVEDGVVIGFCIILPVLVLARQLCVVLENRRLQQSLARLSSELENRVTERTLELAREKEHLAALNQVAFEMTRCTKASEVLRVGTRLVAKAVPCEGGAVLAHTMRGRSCFVTSDGLSKGDRHQLRAMLKELQPEEKTLSAETPTRLDGHDLPTAFITQQEEQLFASITVVPLVSRDMTFGILGLAHRRVDARFTGEEMDLIRSIAAQMAVAFESALRFEDARYLADRDPVTGLVNHRGLGKRLEQEVSRSERGGSCFALIMMDLDNFKLFNDTYGHVVGDRVLASTAKALEKAVRRSDTVGRFGGDEFVAILPDTDGEGAAATVERMRRSLMENPFRVRDGQALPLCMSFGISVYPFQGRHSSELLAAADGNLYRSKQKGGDCVTAPENDEHRTKAPGGVFTVLDGLVNTVDNKDHYTRKHSDDVTGHSIALANELGLSSETQRSLRIAGLLHDVGKIGIPDRVLRKPGPLTEEEYEAIKQHVGLGELIIKEIPNLHEVLEAVASHHERWDGQGYPRGLKGDEIPLLGRILAVTDAYSAMTTTRPYRQALSLEQAEAELASVAGTQLDPAVVKAFVRLLGRSEGAYQTPAVAS